MTLFVVAGERSGDTHAAGLLEALGSDLSVTGLGGPKMKKVAPAVEDWVDEAAVVGLWEVLKHYSFFRQKMEETTRNILRLAPNAVLLIDYPGFNLRLADRLRRDGYTGKIIYYISPQVWAWKKGRIPKMARVLNLMICVFPFEPTLYDGSGLKAVFSGHPMADERPPAESERTASWVGLFPGSRTMEIKRLLPLMLAAAEEILEEHPDWTFHIPAAGEGARAHIDQILSSSTERVRASTVVEEGAARRQMRQCRAALVASGTATLESACHGLPYTLVYRVNWLTYVVGRRVLKIPFLGMVNILAGRQVIRELLQSDCTVENMASEIISLMTDETRREKVQAGMAEAVAKLGGGGAYQHAAEAVKSAL